ncbi:MAG: serine/threonine-protein kinase [Planctomycetota bacterium]|nr:serine/threonine-protein kinase [Planctomycetota bacterium]
MTYHDVQEIFQEAVKRPTEERTAFLDGACGNDADLRQAVELLLQHKAPTVRDQPPTPMPGEYTTGDTIGQFTIRDFLGGGGMGAVYLAEQTSPVRRRVALKVIKPGFDTRNTLARFQAERQALAMLDHPGIAKVLEAGATDAGRPWFAMEYIQGEDLVTYCDERRLATHQRLALFIRVCEAVQHAHQRGIIHRDLKPTNILVNRDETDQHQCKIIDFGIAKAVSTPLSDLTLHTTIGQLVGTLSYMSPEQVRGSDDIDTRTDVYSLGVILYELLAGGVPFAADTITDSSQESLKEAIREDDPPKPSSRLFNTDRSVADKIARARRVDLPDLQKQLRRELEWIPLKALSKDRSERYSSAESLAADVQRYLRGQPLEAVPPTTSYKLKKFLRRNKVPAITAACFLLLLITAITLTSIFAWKASERARFALAQQSLAEQKTEEAKQLADRAEVQKKAADRAIMFIEGIFNEPAKGMLPRVQDLAASIGVMKPTRDQASQAIEQMLMMASTRANHQFVDQPEYEATIRNAISSLYLAMGKDVQARQELERAITLRKRFLGEDNPATVKSMMDMGRLLWFQGKYDASLGYHRDAVISIQRVLPIDDERVRTAVQKLGQALLQRGTDLASTGQLAEAETMYQEAYELYRTNLGETHASTQSMLVALNTVQNAEQTSSMRPPLSRTAQVETVESKDLVFYTRQQLDQMDPEDLRKHLVAISRARRSNEDDPEVSEMLKDQFTLTMQVLRKHVSK